MAINTEVVIVGAGPCGLFQVFELGLLGIKCHMLDSLAIPGGQCAELYPEKPIYDIPALPVCGAQELVDRLLEQIKPFGAVMHFGQEVTEVLKRPDGRFDVRTAGGLEFDAGSIVIAGGVGSFQPRRLGVDGADAFEGTQLFYRVKSAADFHGRHLVIFAGGDINTYPGKKKLILSGFHEAALAAFGIQHYLYPAKRQFLQYTTTSPVMHQDRKST